MIIRCISRSDEVCWVDLCFIVLSCLGFHSCSIMMLDYFCFVLATGGLNFSYWCTIGFSFVGYLYLFSQILSLFIHIRVTIHGVYYQGPIFQTGI